MSASLLRDVEEKLSSDHDGSYKSQLITLVEKYRDEFTFAKQGFLPPDEYEVAVNMEGAVDAALAIIEEYEPVKSPVSADSLSGSAFNSSINV